MPPAKLLTDPAAYLPPVALDLARVVGIHAALRLCEDWPGVPMRIPHECGPDHALALAIGVDLAARLCAEYGGETVIPPALCRRAIALRDLAICAERRTGQSGEALARKYKLTLRHVWRIVAGIVPTDPRQLSLTLELEPCE